MSDSRKRRPRKRLTIELEAHDEPVVRAARVRAAQQGVTLRHYVILALMERNVRDPGD